MISKSARQSKRVAQCVSNAGASNGCGARGNLARAGDVCLAIILQQRSGDLNVGESEGHRKCENTNSVEVVALSKNLRSNTSIDGVACNINYITASVVC